MSFGAQAWAVPGLGSWSLADPYVDGHDGAPFVFTPADTRSPAQLLAELHARQRDAAAASRQAAPPAAARAPAGDLQPAGLPGPPVAGCVFREDRALRESLFAFACMRTHEKALKALNRNAHITGPLGELLLEYESAHKDDVGSVFRARNLKRTLEFFKRLPVTVATHRQLDALLASMPVDVRARACLADHGTTVDKLRELLLTGRIAALEERKAAGAGGGMKRALADLVTIWGVGPVTSMRLYKAGVRSVAQLKELVAKAPPRPPPQAKKKPAAAAKPVVAAHILSDNSVACLAHHADLQLRMPRSEVEEILAFVRAAACRVYGSGGGAAAGGGGGGGGEPIVMCCGSYRRGKPTSGDVDILIAPPVNTGSTYSLEPLLRELEAARFLLHRLTDGASHGGGGGGGGGSGGGGSGGGGSGSGGGSGWQRIAQKAVPISWREGLCYANQLGPRAGGGGGGEAAAAAPPPAQPAAAAAAASGAARGAPPAAGARSAAGSAPQHAGGAPNKRPRLGGGGAAARRSRSSGGGGGSSSDGEEEEEAGELHAFRWDTILQASHTKRQQRRAAAAGEASQRSGGGAAGGAGLHAASSSGGGGGGGGGGALGGGDVVYVQPTAANFLAKHDYKHDSFMGLCRLPSQPAGGGGGAATTAAPAPPLRRHVRRLDIKTYPREYLATAAVYFTGSDYFNRSMRLYVKMHGWSLSDRGLRPVRYEAVPAKPPAGGGGGGKRGGGGGGGGRAQKTKVFEGPALAVDTEEELFRAMGIPYRTPAERDVSVQEAVARAPTASAAAAAGGATAGEEEEEEDGELEELGLEALLEEEMDDDDDDEDDGATDS